MTIAKKLRCAIYTRKSTDEGLDQDYNSLDAQRDAGEAYIKSQKHEGWQLVPTYYDDGGFSGGNLERPGLKKLLNDIKLNKIDIIVVYKVDRLTRSLHDFAKLVEVFDAHSISFVSVTQSFNTTNSMGRLTLNMLLSFAQFEREVTSERIRDKFAASLKKGIWMGGPLSLGYDLSHRKLLINATEAEQTWFVFKNYLTTKSTYDLLRLMKKMNIKTKSWVTQKGKTVQSNYYTKSTLYVMLKNVIYNGKIRHKDKIYDGEHDAIIDDDLWGRVQDKLSRFKDQKLRGSYSIKPYILKNKIFDDAGNKLTTSYSVRKHKDKKSHIRYYINHHATVFGYKDKVKYLNADDIESVIDTVVREAFRLNEDLYRTWFNIADNQKIELLNGVVERIEISLDQLKITLNNDTVEKIENLHRIQKIQFSSVGLKPYPTKNDIKFDIQDDVMICTVLYTHQKYRGRKVITDKNGHQINIPKTDKNSGLITAIITAAQCHKNLSEGSCKTIVDLAKKFGRDRSYISKIMKLHYLSPKIKGIILDGLQPQTTTIQNLLKITNHYDWIKQEQIFGV